MNQLRVRYHQLKIDMFALYQATMDSRGVKVHRVEQALGDMPAPGPSGVRLRSEDADYVQALSEMEKKITVGEHGRKKRHMLRKVGGCGQRCGLGGRTVGMVLKVETGLWESAKRG